VAGVNLEDKEEAEECETAPLSHKVVVKQ